VCHVLRCVHGHGYLEERLDGRFNAGVEAGGEGGKRGEGADDGAQGLGAVDLKIVVMDLGIE